MSNARNTALTVAFWALPVTFLLVWMATRMIAYFVMDFEWNKRDFVGTLFPAKIGADVGETWFRLLGPYFNPTHFKYHTLRLHIALSCIMGLICAIQLMPFLRRRYMRLHRTLGYVYVALLVPFAIEMSFTLYVAGEIAVGPVVLFGNHFDLLCMVGTMAVGVWAAKNHRTALHRACMFIHAASLFVNPTQRFFWVLYSKTTLFGVASTYDEWIGRTLTPAEITAWAACFGTALAYVTVLAPTTINGSRRSSRKAAHVSEGASSPRARTAEAVAVTGGDEQQRALLVLRAARQVAPVL